MDNFESFEIAMLIKEIYSKITNTISKSLKDSGLTYQQIMIIKIIAHKKTVTISDLCYELSLAKGTVSGIVTRLKKLDYIFVEFCIIISIRDILITIFIYL